MKIGSPRWVETIAQLFGVEIESVTIDHERLRVRDCEFDIVDGVILLDSRSVVRNAKRGTADDVRRSFSEEWTHYGNLLPEHDSEFASYFDLIDLDSLHDSVVLDLGCGSGRWSAKLSEYCKTIVLVDFSDAIFVAQANLSYTDNAIFFRGDVTNLPFVDDGADFLFSLGVLHHLDQPCLLVAKNLMRLGPRGLFYLYYNLDNRPAYFAQVLSGVTKMRQVLGRVRSERARRRISRALAWGIYVPMVKLGEIASLFGLRTSIPLHEFYRGKSVNRIEQDAYDRFFTSIEQRVSRADIEVAFPGNWKIQFSDGQPYWHFLVDRG